MMKLSRYPLVWMLAATCAIWITGCGGDDDGGTSNSSSTGGEETAETDTPAANGSDGATQWEDYPDVPFVPIMTDVDGIEIPRLDGAQESIQLKGERPLDLGNEHAQKNPGSRDVGDWLIVRYSTEPKVLNPITESSAVQSYIGQYVQEGLMWQNPETFEYEPHIAKRYEAEDSVKLSPDYQGNERRLALGDGEPAGELEVAAEKEDSKLALKTFDGSGKSLGRVWVGLFPIGKILGAPTSGYHYWSDDDGNLEVTGVVPGKYRARVGAEFFGKTEQAEDGSLTITPVTPDNSLKSQLESENKTSLTLAQGDWIDVQRETIFTYFLRDDVTWSDGESYTADDIAFGYHCINNEFVDGDSIRVYYQPVVSCDALDKFTIRMKYRQQYFKAFEFTMGLSAFSPPLHQFQSHFRDQGLTLTNERLTAEEEAAQKKVSVHGQQFGKYFNTNTTYNNSPLGTGQYIVDKWVRADRVELRRNPNYWKPKRAGYVEKIIFKFIPDDVVALQALKAGDIDVCFRLSPEQYFEDLKGPPNWIKKDYVKAGWFTPAYGYYGWNLLRPKFQDRRVRIALKLLFDVQDFLEKKLHNAGVVVAGSQYYFGPMYDHEVKPIGYDPETAQELLADAGWFDTDNDGVLDKDGEKFEFTLLYPPGKQSSDDRAAIIKKNLKQVGITMNIRTFEWASFLDKVMSKDFDVVNLAWASALESDPYQLWHSSGAAPGKRGSNHVSFDNLLTDQLIEMLRVTLDENKRKRIHASLQRILDQEQPYMFLYAPKEFAAYHKRFRGAKWYAIRPGYDLSEWYVPKGEQLRGQKK